MASSIIAKRLMLDAGKHIKGSAHSQTVVGAQAQ